MWQDVMIPWSSIGPLVAIFSLWLGGLGFYVVRTMMKGRYQSLRVNQIGGTHLLNTWTMEYGYWMIHGLGNLFERLQFLRGYENLMMDFMEKPKEIYELMDMLLDYMLRGTRLVLLLEPDCVAYSDDWGTQVQLIINPREWRHFFKPRYKKLFDMVRAAGAYTHFHSDGMIMEIIPDFMEIGLNILNPQFSCMDLEKLAALTRKRLVILSDIDRQHFLPFGKPAEVRDYTRRVVKTFDAKNGGFIGRGEIAKDVPIENADAMYAAFWE